MKQRSSQAECLAKIGKAALDNPDLPECFIVDALASMARREGRPRYLSRGVARHDPEC